MRIVLALLAAALAGSAALIALEPWAHGRARRLGADPSALPGSRGADSTWLARARAAWQQRAGRKRRAQHRLRVVQALASLASELESGQPALQALASAGGEPSAWPRAAAACAHGDVVPALHADGADDPAIALLAACWEVGASSGAGLAAAVARLAHAARAEEDIRVQLEAHLAAPRASARMLGMLPAVGLGLGMLMGAEPLGWLVGTPVGLACLFAGVVLTALGMWWTSRIAARVEALL